jgi:hypothetical protein
VVTFFEVMYCAGLAASSIVQTTYKVATEAFGVSCIVEKILVGGSSRVISPPEAMT